ncbi:hypothetical protein R1T16_02975 [Flavobacterium sp. DG1-102-2]|uniref:hypothetical protein n=1 Tax=Flavobacterium sp. DG1-102-2 TaxID=3081663 RepID=UPI002949A8B9|nr:hypothetical protein [Flavobacterium sp. DG1-102-2]MDV6167371.1 hypothetical protein [Flavobacterium sp. DG1-102-2]
MANFKEPYYLVDFDAALCNFEIYINDMPAFKHHRGGSIASHYPINHFILQAGLQNIKITILPIKGESELRPDGHLKIKVFCYDSSTTNYEDTVEAFKYDTPDLEKTPLPVINVSSGFSAEVSYDIKGWKNAISFKDVDEHDYASEVISYYKELYNAFKEENIGKIHNVMQNRFEETDISMYLGDADNKRELENLFNRLNSEKYELEPFPDSARLEKFGDSKVLNYIRADGNPVIYYKNISGEEFGYPIFLQKQQTKDSFEIIR